MAKSSGGLSRWFKEEWVDLSRPKKGGGFEPCGRPDADEGKYPKCVPKAKAMKMTQAEIDSAVRRKRRAESTEERKGKKPINVPTEVEKKSKNIPTNPKLYAKVKAEAKRKFDVYPSAYANGWLVQEYKRRGGGYKTVTKQQPDSSEVHVPSTNWKFKRKKNRGLSSLVEKHADHDQKSHGAWANGQGAPSIRRTSYLPPELADRYVQLSREELEYLRSIGDFQQTLFGPEEKVGGLDERLLGFGYRSKAGFVIDVDDSWRKGLDEFGVKFVEDRWGDTELDFSEASPEQIKALVSTVFDTDILSPDGKTLYQVRTKTAGENYDGSVAAGCDIYQVDVATGERTHLRAVIDRTLDFNTGEVSNNVFRLPREAQGKGIGTTLLAHWEDQQFALGLMYANVHAVSGRDSNGGYTWLRTGYEPNDPRDVAATAGDDFWAEHIMYDKGLADEIRSGSFRDEYKTIIQSSIESELPDLSPKEASEFASMLADEAAYQAAEKVRDNIYSAAATARGSTNDGADCLTVGRRIRDELYYADEVFISRYDNTGTYVGSDGVTHEFPGDDVTLSVNVYGYADELQDQWTQILKDSADWYGSKELESLGPAKRNDSVLMRRDAIDADGDGIIFEGTEFERRIGTPKPVEKAMRRGPSKPKSLGELFRWWADNDPAAWENDTPEVQASYQRFLNSKSRKLKKHAEHDQKSHGNWAGGYQQRLFGEPEERYGFKGIPQRISEMLELTQEAGYSRGLGGLVEKVIEEGELTVPFTTEQLVEAYGLDAPGVTADGGSLIARHDEVESVASESRYGHLSDGSGYFLLDEDGEGNTSLRRFEFFDDFDHMVDIEDAAVDWVKGWRNDMVGGVLFHGTTLDKIASIAEMGLESRNDRRGLSNRHIGAAVFLSATPGYSMEYGEALIEVDMDRLQADGVLSRKDAFPEPSVADSFALMDMAQGFGDYDYMPDTDINEYPDTTVIFEGYDVVIPPEYMTLDGTPLTEYAASISKHAEHDQKSHGNWAQGASNPKPYAGKNKKVEDGHPARPLPEVGDRIGIHLDLTGAESGLGKGNAFSIKMVGEGGEPDYSITQAHSLGVRLSNVGSDVNRRILADAIKYDRKNPHAAFTGTVEEWVNSREVPKGAVEIDYWVRPKAKNPDGTDRYTAETTGFWYVKDGTYREFIGASDGIGIGGDRSDSKDKARTYVYGDVELGEVNPYVKEWFEEQKLTKAHRLIHESRTRQRPFELAKHGDHDQLSHGNWAKGRVSRPSQGVPVPDGYVVLSAAERRYLASLPELSQGTLVRPLFLRGGSISSEENLPRLGADGNFRFGEERVSVDPSDFSTVYETKAGMVIDSAEPKYFDEYENGSELADDIFDLNLVTDDGRNLVVEASGYSSGGEGDTSVSLNIKDADTGEHLGNADRRIVDDPWTGVFVENNIFRLNESIQGMGIGTTLLSHWEDQMAKAGIGNMHVHAVSGSGMNGGYTWLRYGYTPNDPFRIVRSAPIEEMFFPDDWARTDAFERILRNNSVAITNKALDTATDNNPGMNIRVDFDVYELGFQVDEEVTRRMDDLRREITSSQQAGSTLFTTAEDVLAAPSLIRNEYESILTREIPVDVSITVRPSDQPFDDRSLDEKRTVRIGVSPALFMNDAEFQEERFYDYLKSSADWYGEKSTSELNLQPKERAVVVRADVIDRDGDGIIFEGTPFERRIGTASRQVAKGKAKKKKLRGPAKPSSLSELARWWADNDPAAWEQDTAEVRASYRRYLFSKARVDSKRKLKKHGTHDQKSHGNWARNLRIFRHIMENEGATFDIRTREFKKDGFAVADPAQAYQAEEKHSSPVFAEEGRKLIGEFIKNWEDELAEPNKYVGAWLDDGNYYLDVATVVMDRSKAIEMGKETDQIAIWDLGANAEVRLRKAGSRVLLVPGDALNEETIELLFNELMGLNDE